MNEIVSKHFFASTNFSFLFKRIPSNNLVIGLSLSKVRAFNIAVRNECFCAHPYVEKMLELTHKIQINKARAKELSNWHTEPWMGMVRVSFGIYNTESDVDHFIHALKDIITKQDEYAKCYNINDNGDYEHVSFQFSCKDYFSLSKNVKEELGL